MKPWGKTTAARRLLGAATPEFKAVRRVRWVKAAVEGGIGCGSCGWAKTTGGHDRWCEFIKGG